MIAILGGLAWVVLTEDAERTVSGEAESAAGPPPGSGYVADSVCGGCHVQQFGDWLDSHHDLAMQEATEETVLGDFDGATLDHFGVESRFFRRDGGFYVTTDGPDGTLEDFEIRYTFRVEPLQQYLIPLSGGRLTACGHGISCSCSGVDYGRNPVPLPRESVRADPMFLIRTRHPLRGAP